MKNTDILSLLNEAERAAKGGEKPQDRPTLQNPSVGRAPNMETPVGGDPARQPLPATGPARPHADHNQLASQIQGRRPGAGNVRPEGSQATAPARAGSMQRPMQRPSQPQAPAPAGRPPAHQQPPQSGGLPPMAPMAAAQPALAPEQHMRQGGTRQGPVQTKPAEAAKAAAKVALSEAAGNPAAAPGQSMVQMPAGANAMAKPEPQVASAQMGSGTWQDQVPTSYGKVVSKGMVYIFGFLGLFTLWAVLFPIDSAVVSAGQVISNGQNKLIQHPSGGVVREILVKDGQKVEAGDLLIRLDKSSAQGELTRLLARHETLNAQKARFEAERNGHTTFSVPESPAALLRGGQVVSSGIDETAKSTIYNEQLKEFDAGRKRFAAQINAIKYQVETFRDQKTGMQARLIGGGRLLEMTNRELRKVRPLAKAGYLPKARLWDLEKNKLEQLTNVENIRSEVAATEQRISEAEAKLAELKQSDREKRSFELSRTIGELVEISDSIKAAQIAVNLTELRAPVSGTIVKLTANTNGGVMGSGETIAEIVPAGVVLTTEFRVPQNKAKHVYPGQTARISITTFNRRTYDPIDAEVTYVSADTLKDETTGEIYFLARAIMKPNPEKNTGIEEVTSGMAAEVYVLAEPRVFASYLFQPIMDSFNRAFREFN